MAAIVNLVAFAWGHVEVFRGTNNNLEGLFVQMFIAGFGVVNCIPIYEAIIFRSDGGKIPRKTCVVATFLAFLLYLAAHVTLRNSATKNGITSGRYVRVVKETDLKSVGLRPRRK
ncbi:cellulose synthase-like protein G3 [Prunus yedoensis var. nudiflora]|uniref:Cellulose synthase-like protein G3 n=1 Tax=Prunus yedoensis var. nudiflora TaxID=2094558 RepID=A0A314XWQ5_PRUYE|nr:cellulose synthase-like protein G3 [Prunus yedoensis var. nudiflora]